MDPDEERPRYRIAEVSTRLGIPIPTIRSWERRYGFPRPGRTQGRHRRYSEREVRELRELRDMIALGHTAREAVALVRRSAARVPEHVPELRAFLRAVASYDPIRAREALNAAAERLGVETAIRDVALTAMREIGSRWEVGACDVAEEHLATDTVRTWLARLRTFTPPPRRGPVVLACAPKDAHSIGLEGFGAILARAGWDVRILGANTPVGALLGAVRATGAPGAVVTAQRRANRRSAVEVLRALDAVPGVTPFYGGAAFSPPAARRGVPGIYLGDDIVEAATELQRALGARPRAVAPR
ncbi:MAG: MerR family transcriptional regulator [Actinomycetota bacterium]|nr:MAG: MerR family transcriptional regulator [Actinomycetota bacterium]